MNKQEQIRQDCWSKAINCLATSYIFQNKALSYGKYLRYINLLGIIVPLIIGGIAMGYNEESEYLKYAVWVATPLSLIQLTLSGIALIFKWESSLSYSLESQAENRILSDEFRELARYPPNDITELERKYELLITRDNERIKQDEKVEFSSKENCKGMRYALKILQINCPVCGDTPKSMQATDCDNCGKF